MSDADVDRCRAEAEKCRRLAARASDPIEKDALQRMADEWLRVAQGSLMQEAANSDGLTSSVLGAEISFRLPVCR